MEQGQFGRLNDLPFNPNRNRGSNGKSSSSSSSFMPSSPLRPHCGHTLSRVWFDVPLFCRPFFHKLRGVVVGVDVVSVNVMVALELGSGPRSVQLLGWAWVHSRPNLALMRELGPISATPFFVYWLGQRLNLPACVEGGVLYTLPSSPDLPMPKTNLMCIGFGISIEMILYEDKVERTRLKDLGDCFQVHRLVKEMSHYLVTTSELPSKSTSTFATLFIIPWNIFCCLYMDISNTCTAKTFDV
ncbi:hypothetical protein Syun_018863 [Stephania yunnanensis]|uniref:Uncharacterized protein n=1 Tax=Stephania yunnanensis TaxID=152371 RepID=A0AAP0IVD8_9MAGN